MLVYLKLRDLLQEVHDGKLTINEARKTYLDFLNSDHAQEIGRLLSLTDVELAALNQGATIANVMKWRFDGWPKVCKQCGQSIHLDEFGWTIPETFDSEIIHVACDQ